MCRRGYFFNRMLVLFVLVALLVLPPGEASARKWVFADARVWNLLRACRDGVILSVIYDPDSTLEADPFDPIHLAVHHYTNPSIHPPNGDGELAGSEPMVYGPQILPYQPVVMSIQDVPLRVNDGKNGLKSYQIHTYATLRWTTSMSPGEDRIIVIQDDNNGSDEYFGSAASIENCTLRQSRFVADASVTINPSNFPSSAPAVPPHELVYRLDGAPSKGDLFNDQELLGQSGTFSQADIEAGRLTYRSSGKSQGDFFAVRPFYTRWASRPLSGQDPDSGSWKPTVSADGRYVAFTSSFSNMDADHPGNRYNQIYLRDRDQDEDGIYDEPDGESLYMISLGIDGKPADQNVYDAQLSADGRFIAFYSGATNLVSGDDEGVADVFVAGDGKIVLVSVASDGTPGNGNSFRPALSGDGRFVVFTSFSKNFGNSSAASVRIVYVHDRDVDDDGVFDEPGSIQTEAIASQADSNCWGASISANGRYVVFTSAATNLHPRDNKERTDVFYYDRQSGKLELVSGFGKDGNEQMSDGNSWLFSKHSISADGRYVAFESDANFDNYDDNGYADIYLYDNLTHSNRLVSHDYWGLSGHGDSYAASISADGRFIAFRSLAYDLIDGDTESSEDVFVYDQTTREMVSVTENFTGKVEPPEDWGTVDQPVLSGDGSFVVFWTRFRDLAPDSRTECIVTGEALPCSNIVAAHVGFPMLFPLEIQQGLFLPLLR